MNQITDPRIFFAAERTLLSWTRTSLTLMGFGFLVERFGLFLFMQPWHKPMQRSFSFWVGLIFISLGITSASLASHQFTRIVKTLAPSDIPAGHPLYLGVFTTLGLGILGLGLIVYLSLGF